MMQRITRTLTLMLLSLGALMIAACGSVATPEWAAEAQATQVAQLATDEHLTAIAPTFTPTNTPIPTETPVPTNTPTPVPPTETPIPPTSTPEPTVIPPTEVPAADEPSGDPAAGQVVFTTTFTTSAGAPWACSTCHSVTPDEMRLIGPGLWNVSVRAETRVAGETAYEYIRHSILAPSDFIVPEDAGGPYADGLMPHEYETLLTPEQLEDVIAYLFTLK